MRQNNCFVDLHTHSNASDGQYSPSELVHLARKASVEILALTDHDTTAGLQEARRTAEALGIHFVDGIELDSKYPGIGGRFHILGYGIDSAHEELKGCCSGYAQQRLERAGRILTYLEKKGISIPFSRIEELAGGGVIGRPHFARAMVEAGFVATIQEAFERFLDTEEFQTIDRPKPHPRQAIEMITKAGGLAVLAHPYQIKLGEHSLEDLLRELKSYGLAGMECYYSSHTQQQTEALLSLARQYELCITAGSDFHGELVKPGVSLGTVSKQALSQNGESILNRL